MTQTPGKVHTPGAEVVTSAAFAPRRRSIAKAIRVGGAAAISATLVGVFALPVYATSYVDEIQADLAYAQALTTNTVPEIAVPTQLPTAEEQPIVVSYAIESSGGGGYASGWTKDVAASGIGNAIVDVAYSELGAMQDCTDLVQNALAGVGLADRRDQGGYDHGPYSLRGFGAEVTNGEWAPGDILGWPGYPHVAIYIGNGLAIHGGMGGSTVVAGATDYFGTPAYVVRPG